MSFIARYIYTYEELVFVTETEEQWPDKNTDNKKNNNRTSE